MIKKEISLIMSHYHAADTPLLRKRKDTKFPTDHSYRGEKEDQAITLLYILKADYLCDGNNFTLAQVYCHNFHVTLIYVHNNITLNIMSPCILRDPPSEL